MTGVHWDRCPSKEQSNEIILYSHNPECTFIWGRGVLTWAIFLFLLHPLFCTPWWSSNPPKPHEMLWEMNGRYSRGGPERFPAVAISRLQAFVGVEGEPSIFGNLQGCLRSPRDSGMGSQVPWRAGFLPVAQRVHGDWTKQTALGLLTAFTFGFLSSFPGSRPVLAVLLQQLSICGRFSGRPLIEALTGAGLGGSGGGGYLDVPPFTGDIPPGLKIRQHLT